MWGLIFALCYVVYGTIYDGSVSILIESTFPFLWYWHLVFGIFNIFIALISFVAGFFIKDPTKGGSLSGNSLVAFLATCITLPLQLSGIYLMDVGVESGYMIHEDKFVVGLTSLLTSIGLSILFNNAIRGNK